jgi:hypothetical protein
MEESTRDLILCIQFRVLEIERSWATDATFVNAGRCLPIESHGLGEDRALGHRVCSYYYRPSNEAKKKYLVHGDSEDLESRW